MPSEYYRRFRDTHIDYVMVEIRAEQGDGRPGGPFNVMLTEEEYEELRARSRRQYERGRWPRDSFPYRPARDEPRTHWTNDSPRFDGDFFPSGPDPYAFFQEKVRQEQQENRERKAKAEEERARRARNEPPPTQAKSEKQLKERLAELAGSVWIETMSLKSVYTKARRRCHPDMEGGSHALWIELEEIAHLLGIVKKKQPTR